MTARDTLRMDFIDVLLERALMIAANGERIKRAL
jgi:hypothetical protein